MDSVCLYCVIGHGSTVTQHFHFVRRNSEMTNEEKEKGQKDYFRREILNSLNFVCFWQLIRRSGI